MSRLATNRWQAHEDAEALLSLSRDLTDAEIEQVLTDWNPAARHNIGVAGAFFTPMDLAHDVAACTVLGTGGRYLDLCAGTGRLTWRLYCLHRWDSPLEKARTSYTCVEVNPEFVDVGRRLMPWADWVLGSAFDQNVMEPLGMFDVGVSNPPFGKVKTGKARNGWLNYTGQADLQACEVLGRTCKLGAMVIMPLMSLPWDREGKERKHNDAYNKWAAGQQVALVRTSLDVTIYEGFESAKGVSFDVAELVHLEEEPEAGARWPIMARYLQKGLQHD